MFKKINNKKYENRKKIVNRGVYFITQGDNQGVFVVSISEHDTEKSKAFLTMPDFSKTHMLKSEIPTNFASGALQYANTLPKDVYAVCLAQYIDLK